ncbi:patatin-like phospholipase family protein [Flavisphingomonas formosensis]|uniref:patatin-like phospholipase family protein n=1 Tax=Flavisphingomonas formosensis TaxID=861534 RepID=UPI0012FCFB1C|nr:patatin-like phospholipase family protein [Sphingomonas formosensis]
MARRESTSTDPLPLPDEVVLVLQGGGALGSYQAGVYEALSEVDIQIDRVAGISIGAVNSAIIAGNPPERRVERLRAFWERMTSALPSFPIWPNDQVREFVHEWSAGFVATVGVPGFFHPRLIPAPFAMPGTDDALSFYDSSALADTLNELVDWNLLNDGPVRLSVGAVDVETGNFDYFDTRGPRKHRIDARHIMASGALPPGLPPVEIDKRLWWDGGLVSNTPLGEVIADQREDMLVFQVDLFSSVNQAPRTINDVIARAKEIQFSSRTRQITDQLMKQRAEHAAIARLLAKLPPDFDQDPDVAELRCIASEYALNIVHLIYRANAWEGGSRDFEFSRRTMQEHWAAGRSAVEATISRSGLLARNIIDGRSATFDLTNHR